MKPGKDGPTDRSFPLNLVSMRGRKSIQGKASMKIRFLFVALPMAFGGCSAAQQTAAPAPSTVATASPAPPTAPAELTEANARSILMEFGCTNVSGLSQTSSGKWHGSCTKSGAMHNVVVDTEGHASFGDARHLTAGNARFLLMRNGCTNLGRLVGHKDGSWSAPCSKAGVTKIASVAPNGTITTR